MDGKVLVSGDRVEAKYKGRGTKYFSGKISSVIVLGGVTSFNILYDDGDKEDGAKSENIRRIGSSKADDVKPSSSSSSSSSSVVVEEDNLGPRGKDMDGKVLVSGDRVEAKYKGRGTKYFSGKISSVIVLGDQTSFNILYDDGDKEDGAKSENIRRIGSSKADSSTPLSPSNATRSNVLSSSEQSSSSQVRSKDMDGNNVIIGDRVEAIYKGRGNTFEAAKIADIRVRDGVTSFVLTYDAGDIEDGASGSNFRIAKTSISKTLALEREVRDLNGLILNVGDKTESRYKGKGAKYYPGKITAIKFNADGEPSISIGYDDGDKEDGALCSNIRRLDSSASSGGGSGGGGPSSSSSSVVEPRIVEKESRDFDRRDGGRSTEPSRSPRASEARDADRGSRSQRDDDRDRSYDERDRGRERDRERDRDRERERERDRDRDYRDREEVLGRGRSTRGRSDSVDSFERRHSSSNEGNRPPLANVQPSYTPYQATTPAIPTVATFGRLARELAAVRVRARPAIFDAFIAQSRAKAQAADPGFSGTILPADKDIEAFLLGCIRRSSVTASGARPAATSATTPKSTSSSTIEDSSSADMTMTVGTTALLQGLRAAGFSASREQVAVLRSAFRMRTSSSPEKASAGGGDTEKEHAAILILPLVQFLSRDDTTATQMLLSVDEMASQRSGRVRPFAGGMQFANGPAATPYNGQMFSSPYPGNANILASPMPPTNPFGMSAAFGTPLRGTASTIGYNSSGRGGFGVAPPPPLSSSVGEWVSAQATAAERENLALLMRSLQDFEARTGVPQPARGGSVISEGGDSVVIALGPRLKVGLKVYVQ